MRTDRYTADCPVCGLPLDVTRQGTVRAHWRLMPRSVRDRERCPGGGAAVAYETVRDALAARVDYLRAHVEMLTRQLSDAREGLALHDGRLARLTKRGRL